MDFGPCGKDVALSRLKELHTAVRICDRYLAGENDAEKPLFWIALGLRRGPLNVFFA